ncbi:hypothetical protein D5S18_19660 [Nocardia panacis]|uniref:Uncharacterized protein n=1 Tax=Nocardia panacis TaxID=2340916 RepID=A0A3A4K4U3_9NOCA|nr:hypothetical protein [Nocardia panacis]RJO73441.1 hypothetical protein D5S18_19660 [Nocardia panacis]
MEQPLPGGRVGFAEAALADYPVNGRNMSTPSTTRGDHRTAVHDRDSAVAFVIDAVESTGAATRHDFDIDRIVSTAHAFVDDWDIQILQPATFWRIAAGCIRQ